MEVIARINIDTPEGREIVERLRKYPEEVSFEENIVSEPETAYETQKKTESNPPEGYVTLEEFRIEAKKRVRKLLNENGIYK